MNCANHPQNPVAAYCRTCGKPLCTSCTRPVMGVIYCEQCLAERVAGTAPPQPSPYEQPTSSSYQPGTTSRPVGSGPNPGLAGILGAIPFGVGAIYNGQYTKGLAHLGIFVFLVVSLSSQLPDYLYTVLGIALAFFVVYQIVDAVRTAKAIQANQPVPDPFGLATMFSPGGEKTDFARGVPTGAVILIGLGVLFLLHNLGIWFLDVGRLWPIVLIVLGVWLFVKRQTCTAHGDFRHRGLAGPAVLITVGVLALLDNLHGPEFHRTWPVILLVIGAVRLLERSGHLGGPSSQFPGTFPPAGPPPAQQPPAEVNSEVKNG
jgi:Domain of unknown function (DUF5668)/B-box zinc finger